MSGTGAVVGDASLLESVCALVHRVAAEEVMPRHLHARYHRKADGSPCSDADLSAQAALAQGLHGILPAPVLGEEMPLAEQTRLWESGHDGLWCVDPVDGTSNFLHGSPYFAISVALLRQGVPVLGVVHAPALRETFTAVAGAGSRLDGRPLQGSTGVTDLRSAIALVDFKRVPRPLGEALIHGPPYASHRSLGATTLEWCHLAAGRLHVYLHGGQKLWDYAAGSLVLAEAGGGLGRLESEAFWSGESWRRSVVAASTPGLYRQWREWVGARHVEGANVPSGPVPRAA